MENNPPYAGFWRRTAALLIDIMVLWSITPPLAWLSLQSRRLGMVEAIGTGVVSTLYMIISHGSFGRTLGKLAVRIQVRSLDFSKITYKQAFLRSLIEIFAQGAMIACTVYAISQIPEAYYVRMNFFERAERLSQILPEITIVALVAAAVTYSEVIVMLTNRRRRSIHDLIAGTVVVKII